jgi:hypothetical protein
MAEWTQCPSCQLKHAIRPDGLCPRCRHPIAASSWRSVSASPPPAAPAAPPAPEAILAYPAPTQIAGGYPTAQPVPGGDAAAPYAFTVSRFLSGVFSTWGRNAGWVIPTAILLWAPTAVAMYRAYSGMSPRMTETTDPKSFALRFAAAFILILLLMPVELLAIARAGVRRLQGEPVRLGDMLGAVGRSYFPAFALLFLVGLAYIGTACTIVVPFMLLTGWAASVPAMTTEGLGPIAAMKRSWALTRGLRWQVFAGFLVVALALFAVACLLQSLATALVVGMTMAAGGPERAASSMAVMQASSMLLQGLESSVFTTATAVAYHQLRVAAEGPAASHLGRVFE